MLDLSNDRIDRIAQVIHAIENHHPRNTDGPIMIIAPASVHRQWKHAWRRYREWRIASGNKTTRYIAVIDVHTLKARVEDHLKSPDDPFYLSWFDGAAWTILCDDVYPEQREPMVNALKQLGADELARHRLFMTAVVHG
ncbi:hypothetical protein H1O16_gp104 [Burkholderia phage BcepSaruman]|uniref:Uncharacterized protein n=1 Tax=Burkholderia phage BcepSaruman TaxID=2530032 RepID=A0A4D5ZE30_9CAUD|nr:hypothetical protein H1O16_gp104 [Burkholderia phage BcepSaruman]QBX06517.1 hypothetical protein BcepSaruman_104 [Burkholderia phage BcepSaruman]